MQVKKQIKILQNRLEKALAKHNGTLASNRTLRENIDNLRRERLVFNQMYKKLEKEIVDRKKDMLHIIEARSPPLPSPLRPSSALGPTCASMKSACLADAGVEARLHLAVRTRTLS